MSTNPNLSNCSSLKTVASEPPPEVINRERLWRLCQNCGEDFPSWRALYPQLQIFQCPRCLSFSYLPAKDLRLSDSYGHEYFHGAEYTDYRGHKDVHYINFERKWKLLSPFLPSSPAVLELGCAYGFFIDVARRHGATHVFGVDVSPDAIHFAERHFGANNFALAEGFQEPPFRPTVLVAWDVWEHMPYPFEEFRHRTATMPSGSILALTTVDSGALVARIRKSKWRQIHPPTHVHYPTRKGLVLMLERLGFELCYHRSFGVHRALETYVAPFGLLKLAQRWPALAHIPVPLNLGDTQLLIARKRNGSA